MAHLLLRGFNANKTLFLRSTFFRSTTSSSATAVSKISFQPTIARRTFMDHNHQRLLRKHAQGTGGGITLPAWLIRFLADKPVYTRYSGRWWWEKVVVCVVFAITGSTTAYFVRPFVEKVLHLQGSMWEGPWSYRVAYLVTITPIYSFLLVVVGTLLGRHAFFKQFAKKMWTRMIPRF